MGRPWARCRRPAERSTRRRFNRLCRGSPTCRLAFGGNPLACAAGLATIRVIQDEHLVERAADLGGYLMARLEALARRHPGVVKQVRGKGLLIGVEFTDPDIVLLVTAEALQRGVIV